MNWMYTEKLLYLASMIVFVSSWWLARSNLRPKLIDFNALEHLGTANSRFVISYKKPDAAVEIEWTKIIDFSSGNALEFRRFLLILKYSVLSKILDAATSMPGFIALIIMMLMAFILTPSSDALWGMITSPPFVCTSSVSIAFMYWLKALVEQMQKSIKSDRL